MTLSVNTNVQALIAQLNLSRSSDRLNVSLERLSTGLKINRAVDDAAGLVISEFQRAQLSGLDQAITNIDRAVTFAQTAEAALGEINTLLIELRVLAVDSANQGSLNPAALDANQDQTSRLLDSIDSIAANSRFGTQHILDGSVGLQGLTNTPNAEFLAALDDSILPAPGATPITLNLVTTQTATQATTTTTQTFDDANGSIQAGGEELIINGILVSLDEGFNATQIVDRVNEFSGQTGVSVAFDPGTDKFTFTANEFGSVGNFSIVSNRTNDGGDDETGINNTVINVTGKDVAGTIDGDAATGRGQVLIGDTGQGGAGIAIRVTGALAAPDALILTNQAGQFQIGAFSGETDRQGINNASSSTLGVGVGEVFNTLRDIDVRSADGATDAIRVIDGAIDDIARKRGEIGAFQAQTLETTQSNLSSQFNELSNAESVLRDTDFTTEITDFTNEQIRQQTATTVLGLANQQAQAILALLAG